MCLFIFWCTQAQGLELGDAFHSLVSTTQPGVYQSQVRGYATAGGFDVHFPTQSVQLVSVTPPSYSAGCNGIDLFMGGLSYISGEQFVGLLKGIAANAMGYSFSLAMRTLCPVCSTVVSDLQHVAQSANQLAIHQCQFAMGLVNSATGMQAGTHLTQQAALSGANAGVVSDFLSGLATVGDDVAKALDVIERKMAHIHQESGRAQAAQETELGSDTWQLLSGLDKAQRVFLQSILGTTVRYPYPTGNPKSVVVEPVGASMNMHQLADLLMYGEESKQPDNGNIWVNICQDAPYKNPWLAQTGEQLCLSVKRQRLQDSQWYQMSESSVHGLSVADYGFFGISYALMGQALQNIAQKKSLGTPASVALPVSVYGPEVIVQAAFSPEEIRAFIGMAPVPLYRAMNFAAVYPSMAHAMVHNIAEMIAAHYAMTYIRDRILNITHAGNQGAGQIGLSHQKLQALEGTLRTMHYRLQERVKLMVSRLNTKQAWTHQVNQVQSQINAQAWENGLDRATADELDFITGGGS